MPIKLKDYYWILDVPSGASPSQVRRAYLKLARKYHPDLNPESRLAEEKFKELQEAYAVLSDPDRRRAYDDQVRQPLGASPRRPSRPAPRAAGRTPAPAKHGFGDFIQNIFGIKPAGTSRAAGLKDGKTPEPKSQLVLSLEDAHKGGVHQITLLERRRCPICRGHKKLDGRPCHACGASGRVHTPVKIDVNIPPGARNGSIIKVAGRPGTGRRPQAGAEVYVKVVVEVHPVFKIDGDDIYFEVPITPWEAALGAEIEVGGIEGCIQIRITPGAQGGKRVRLRGEGLNRRDGTRGDAYVRLNIVVPKNPGEREKVLYRELARVTGFKPRSRGHSE